ncbi:DUF3322 domain-containing protein [Massilia sp. PWRC2]|uniref:DUF3322 domain-containing protein n=1 Tax=Massilia sp. PWRC2 TaxID=2804626 RepID=UPI003CF2FBB7
MTLSSSWSTPTDIRQQVQRLWDDGRLLAAPLEGATLFPLELRLRQPTVADIGAQFDAVRSWIRTLEAGRGYDIVWREINHRQTGRNLLPDRVMVASEFDALRLIGRSTDARRFEQLAADTLSHFPQLRPWLARRPLTVLEHAEHWPRMLAILRWFVSHPQPGIYLRQLDIVGVDSKFIEARKGLFTELLDLVLPADAIAQDAVGARQFEARFGVLAKPALVRMRILDPALMLAGLSDLSMPVSQFARLEIGARRVFVTENEINGLAFPNTAASIVVFGGGYGVSRLAEIAWLQRCDVIYWGDIDTHGFAILDRLRARVPHARSLLMDAATLHAHRSLWGTEEIDKRHTGELQHLNDEEQAVYRDLRDDVLAERVRMEQERIGFGWVREAVDRV